MYPIVWHISGPWAINSFGFTCLIGLTIFVLLTIKNPARSQSISAIDYLCLITEGTLFGLLGGKIVFILSHLGSSSVLPLVLELKNGFSVVGVVPFATAYVAWFLWRNGISIFAITDLIAAYAPIIHTCIKIGCFLAGCCYGKPTHLPWAVTYTNPATLAPLNCALHPTQLYSSLAFLGMFFLLTYLFNQHRLKPGQITMLYLMLSSLERFAFDFLRNDRVILQKNFISFHQYGVLVIFFLTFVGFGMLQKYRYSKKVKKIC